MKHWDYLRKQQEGNPVKSAKSFYVQGVRFAFADWMLECGSSLPFTAVISRYEKYIGTIGNFEAHGGKYRGYRIADTFTYKVKSGFRYKSRYAYFYVISCPDGTRFEGRSLGALIKKAVKHFKENNVPTKEEKPKKANLTINGIGLFGIKDGEVYLVKTPFNPVSLQAGDKVTITYTATFTD